MIEVKANQVSEKTLRSAFLSDLGATYGVWRNWLARCFRVAEVRGSSPRTPTMLSRVVNLQSQRVFCAFQESA